MPLPRRAEASLLCDLCVFVLNTNNRTPGLPPVLETLRGGHSLKFEVKCVACA
jgi:hypothetical protein